MVGKSYDERLAYLTILPHDWSYSRFKEEFNLTSHCIRVVKEMQVQQIEKRERKKRCDAIDPAIIQRCQDFYRKPYISRELPDEKNAITIETEDGPILRSRSILYENLSETYQMFLSENQDLKEEVGMRKFAEFRPSDVIFQCQKSSLKICLCRYVK